MTASEQLQNYRKRVNSWKNEWVKEGKYILASGIKSKQNLLPSVKGRVRNDRDGSPERIGMSFDKVGIYIHLGVGRGYTIASKGSGVVVKTKGGEMKRKPVPWINESLNSKLSNLTEIVAEEIAKLVSLGVKHTLEEKVVIRGLK